MNANELLQKLIASGADEKGILDRFCGNVELYYSCFVEFLDEPCFATLRDAIGTGNYEEAFDAAHALKGLSGNLGLTAFYNAIRTITESLRNAEYDNIEQEYAEVERQNERLKRIFFGEPIAEQQAITEAAPQTTRKRIQSLRIHSYMKDKNNRIIVGFLCATVLIIISIALIFLRINIVHSRNVEKESGQHLTEINNQIKLYIEDNIATDWSIAQSVGDSILDSTYVDDDTAVLDMLQNKRDVWGVSDIMLYTENGYSIFSDGSTQVTDVSSKTIYDAREQGSALSIIESKLFFTVPLDTTLSFHGSKLVAISVVRDMSSFLDDMHFSSFSGEAYMYLTNQNGIVITSLSGPSTIPAFNIQATIQGKEIVPLDTSKKPEDYFTNTETAVFLLTDDSNELYGVSTQIMTGAEPMRLYYFVPESVVNSIMSGFSKQLVEISIVIISMFTVITVSAFMFLYKSRKDKFDHAIQNREHMFDLLVQNTKTAFGLYNVGFPQPEYQSANATDVVGDTYWTLEKTEKGYRIRNEKHIETDNISIINETLQDWDGKTTFQSKYLCNAQKAIPTYFIFELYPVEEGTSKYVGIMQDVTQAYIREEAVKNAMDREKRANSAKTNFLSNMSHDIRTPMNAIMNMSSFALESINQPKKLNNYLHVIHESAEHLLHLINDILDMNRIESGKLIIASTPFLIKKEMQRQADIIRSLCNAKKQTLITDFGGLSETLVLGDALKLSQVVINLLSNATKFTPEKGAVRFIVKEIPSLNDNVISIYFTVEDNGVGIPQTDIKHIFEPFTRSTDKSISGIEGTGLGLAIVKNYIEAMGGTIRCESEHGEGSIFTVELYFQKADMTADQNDSFTALTNESFLGMHALVAEDNTINQMIAKDMLERMGFILDFADDGSLAVKMFCDSKPYTYDVIYMDIQMPVMNGYDATKAIRASSHPQAKTIPIIAMTANAFAEDIEKARLADMDGYVSKPIVSSVLAEQTDKAINKTRGEKA